MEKTIDRTELFTKYQDKWVALTDDDKVIVSGTTLDEVLTEAKNKGFDNPVTVKTPDLKSEFIL
ncbi:MAG: DUF5678 domain-containing protein [Planctomycetota bacterium]